jgi:hypothetical protein
LRLSNSLIKIVVLLPVPDDCRAINSHIAGDHVHPHAGAGEGDNNIAFFVVEYLSACHNGPRGVYVCTVSGSVLAARVSNFQQKMPGKAGQSD